MSNPAEPLRIGSTLIAPMKWEDFGGRQSEANTPFGVYRVGLLAGEWRVVRMFCAAISSKGESLRGEIGESSLGLGMKPDPATMEEAKALAQTDYEWRVRMLLATLPPAYTGSGDLVARLRRQPEDDGGPSRMDMLRERLEAADEIERLRAQPKDGHGN